MLTVWYNANNAPAGSWAARQKCPRGDCPSEVFLVFTIHAPQFPVSLLDLRVDVGFLVRASHTLNLSPSHSQITSRSFALWEPTPLRHSIQVYQSQLFREPPLNPSHCLHQLSFPCELIIAQDCPVVKCYFGKSGDRLGIRTPDP